MIREFTQIENIDFHETYAFTLRFESLRLFFAYAILYNLIVKQMNINNAYLNSDLDKEIYIMLSLDYSFVINVKNKILLL